MTKCETIRKHINDNGLKQGWVAQKCDIEYARFRRLMTGRATLTADENDRIEKTLGITL